MANQLKSYIDRSREKIIWKNSVPYSQSDIFYMEMAGITYPHENYAIRRNRNNSKRSFEYLYVIEYVTSGAGYIESEEKSARVGEGDIYIIHRRTVHAYYADKQQPFCKKWINVSGQFMNAMEKTFLGEEPFTVIHMGKKGEQLLDSIHSLVSQEISDIDKTYNEIMKLLFDMFLSINDEKKSLLGELSLFECIADFIDCNVSSNITVSYLSERFFTSPSTLYRTFVKSVGMSPKEYITSRKIAAAKRMIAANDSTFNTIATSLGFYDSHHFFRVFHAFTGMSPTEYKNKVLNEE